MSKPLEAAPKVGEVIERVENGKFAPGVSGNPNGRPKGSRNKITLLKLMAEEAVREGNADRMLEVCKKVIDQALVGDIDSQKLVWAAVMSKSNIDTEKTVGEKVTITIGKVESAPKVARERVERPEDGASEDEPKQTTNEEETENE